MDQSPHTQGMMWHPIQATQSYLTDVLNLWEVLLQICVIIRDNIWKGLREQSVHIYAPFQESKNHKKAIPKTQGLLILNRSYF